MQQQLLLNIALTPENTFANYYISPTNQALIYSLLGFVSEPSENFIYIWGKPGSGRTHLLQAACHAANQQQLLAIYLPLQDKQEFSTALLESLEQCDLVCLDNIECIAGDKLWEEAVFHLFNRLRDAHKHLIVAAPSAPTHLSLHLADLQSRLSSGLTFQVASLRDIDKQQLLQMRAKERGLQMNANVANYLMKHWPRDIQALLQALAQLDQASLLHQRKLTLPFVKQTLNI
jgi:DnaA family protein